MIVVSFRLIAQPQNKVVRVYSSCFGCGEGVTTQFLSRNLSGMPGQILLVEDEPSIAENIRYALTREGFDVVWESTIEDGLKRLEDAPNLILLDVGLPDGSGFDFCRKLRESGQTPVIFLTARNEEIDRVVGLEMGGDDYIAKPFSPREMVARVRAVLRRTQSLLAARTAEKPETNDDVWRIDDHRKTIYFHEVALDLSKTEYRLLQTLVESPGRVYNRDQLMERAWDDPAASLDRTVDAHIKSLRAKLRGIAPESDEVIKTHRGLGYSLAETS